MKLGYLMAASLAFLAGCNEMPVRDATDRGTAQSVISFNDMQSFDSELRRSLNAQPEKITVTVDDRIPLKDMPSRMDKWLAAVDNSGGKVTVKSEVPELRTRALPLIGVAISAYQMFKEHAKDSLYDNAKAYDATVFYKRDANGDRLVDRIEMSRRQNP